MGGEAKEWKFYNQFGYMQTAELDSVLVEFDGSRRLIANGSRSRKQQSIMSLLYLDFVKKR